MAFSRRTTKKHPNVNDNRDRNTLSDNQSVQNLQRDQRDEKNEKYEKDEKDEQSGSNTNENLVDIICKDEICLVGDMNLFSFYCSRKVFDNFYKLEELCVKELFKHNMFLCDETELTKCIKLGSLPQIDTSTSRSAYAHLQQNDRAMYKLSISGISEKPIDCILTASQTVKELFGMLRNKYVLEDGDLTFNDKVLNLNTLARDCGFENTLNMLEFKEKTKNQSTDKNLSR